MKCFSNKENYSVKDVIKSSMDDNIKEACSELKEDDNNRRLYGNDWDKNRSHAGDHIAAARWEAKKADWKSKLFGDTDLTKKMRNKNGKINISPNTCNDVGLYK
jgi:hypothetical protein